MAIQFTERDGRLAVEVLETFHAEDANLIEATLVRLPAGPAVEVDFRRCREKNMLALWLLAQSARSEPGRYRVTGLTMADTRFLALVGMDDLEARVH